MTLYRAYRRIEMEYEKILLLIVGSGVEEIENKFKNKDNVKFIGSVNDGVKYLQAMDIYVLPSLTETTSLATLEAMGCEVACVTTKVGRIKEYIKEKVNGLFFPKGNDLVLSLKLRWLLEHPNIRRQLGKKARTTVVKYHKWQSTALKITEILKAF